MTHKFIILFQRYKLFINKRRSDVDFLSKRYQYVSSTVFEKSRAKVNKNKGETNDSILFISIFAVVY